jgi:CYTH domain-containing protein
MDADPAYRQIRKTRYCFVYNNQYLEIDIYPFWKDKAILEVEITNENGQVEIPETIKIIKEVTDKKEYKNSYISKNYEKFKK